MKIICLFPLQPRLPLSMELLLLLVTLALPSVDILAQDTTLARIPQVELIPVSQNKVMDYYINKVWTSKGWKITAYDSAKESVLNFDQNALIAVSPNQRYFTVAKPVPSPKGGTMAYDVELRSVSNSVLAKGRMSSLGSDGEESQDEFMPANDGLSIIHKANLALSGGLHFVFFQRKSRALIKRFELDKTAFWNANVIYEPSQKMIVATFEGHIPDTKISQTHIQCYSHNGALQWETALDSQHVESPLFISAFDGIIAFVSRNVQDRSHNNLFLFRKNGEVIRYLPVHHFGSYERANFQILNGKQHFLISSGGEYYYVIDPANGEIINRQTQGNAGSYVTGLAMIQQYIVTSYFTGKYQQGPDNTQEFAIMEQGLGMEDARGVVTYLPLDVTGEPLLVSTEDGLFLREKLRHGINETNKFYKINLK